MPGLQQGLGTLRARVGGYDGTFCIPIKKYKKIIIINKKERRGDRTRLLETASQARFPLGLRRQWRGGQQEASRSFSFDVLVGRAQKGGMHLFCTGGRSKNRGLCTLLCEQQKRESKSLKKWKEQGSSEGLRKNRPEFHRLLVSNYKR